MEQANVRTDSLSIGIITAAMASIIWVAASTIVGELHAPFKDWLKATLTHHWVGKSVIAIAIFVFVALVATLLSRRLTSVYVVFLLRLLVWISIIGVIAIVGFYIYKDFFVQIQTLFTL